jgi:hypothetical protein
MTTFVTYPRPAYATTVHGIWRKTTDERVVGPNVDTAGPYVDLTRRRRHDQAIVVTAAAIAATVATVDARVHDSRAVAHRLATLGARERGGTDAAICRRVAASGPTREFLDRACWPCSFGLFSEMRRSTLRGNGRLAGRLTWCVAHVRRGDGLTLGNR